jgi:hypothetical protein
MSVVFKTFEVIEIDGIVAGNIVDVISNHGPRRAEVLTAFGVYCEQVKAQNDAELSAQVETLTAEKATLTEQLSEKNTLATSQATTITALESQVATLSEEKAVLLTQVYSLEGQLEQAETEITFLEAIRTYDPNQIKSKAFYDRITKEEMNDVAVLALSGDATAAAIYAKFNDYVKNEWQVLLDDPEVVGGTQYLTYTGTFKEGRAAQITRPASREEAYIAS